MRGGEGREGQREGEGNEGHREGERQKRERDRGMEREKKEKKKRWRKGGRKEGRQPICHLLRIPAQFLEWWWSNGLIYTKVLMAYSGYALQRSLSAQRLCETLCTLRNHRLKRNF